ncbi:MAG: nucleotidyl transferase AbiEii/AbiGii toxin family protein [Proteobacteria bacterium]|nr:nucleotidyl transferase AbiEii/AbiGii toxin family protein [Pseudomonadota bacterium]
MIVFLIISAEEQSALIKKAGNQFDLPDLIIEKDLWVCWLLEKIFALPIQMAFKGGTSLSKVFGLIKRFSEDCDVTIDYRNFKPELDLEHLSKTQIKKVSEQLKEQLKVYVSEVIFPYLQEQISKTFPGKMFELTLSEDGEQLRFYYPNMMNTPSGYLRDHVFTEFGVRNSTEPCDKHLVLPYLAEIVDNDLDLPKPTICTLSPIRTFWEKATLIHVECHRDRLVKTPERLSRHWYDLFMLNNSWVGEQALSSSEILKSVIEHKKAFFNASYANYDDCLSQKFRLIPTASYLENLEQDFRQMIEAGMFHEPPLKFDQITESLKILEQTINKI